VVHLLGGGFRLIDGRVAAGTRSSRTDADQCGTGASYRTTLAIR
jgi:hypothetical protein